MSHTPGEHDEPTDRPRVENTGARPAGARDGVEHDDAVYDDGTNQVRERESNARLVAVVAGIVVLALIAGLLLWHPWSRKKGGSAGSATPSESPSSVAPTTSSYGEILSSPSRMFRAGNVYSQDITKAPVSQNSPAMVGNLTAQVKKYYRGHTSLNYDQYNGTLWVADKNTKKVTVGYDNCQNKKKGDEAGLLNGPKYFVDVPIPANAQAAKGTDGQLAIWSPSQNTLWELWQAKKKGGKWVACWGGRIDNVSQSLGQMPFGFGASASGLAVTGSMVSVEEAKKLDIQHAVGLNIPEPAKWPNWSYPANRTDGGSSAASALPEGSRLRLDPDVDVDSLNLTPLAKAIAKAAQTYGFIVTDKSGVVAVVAEGGQRRMVNGKGSSVAANPWASVLKGSSADTVLKNFPWDKLQVVQKDWGKPAGDSSSSGSN